MSQYGAATKERRTWRGTVYDSQAEMMYASVLDADPQVLMVIEQPKVRLGEDCFFHPDFFVLRRDVSAKRHTGATWCFVDVQGVETAALRKIMLLWGRYGPGSLHVVGPERTDEIIEGGGRCMTLAPLFNVQ